MAIRRYNPGYAPPATLVLVVLNVAIAIADAFSGAYLERLFWARGIDVQYGDYWRIVTCAFVHADFMHIAFNAYGIYVLGSLFERLHGARAFLVVYGVSLLAASGLAMTFMDPNVPLLGASGAAYGLFGAVLGVFYTKTNSIRGLLEIPLGRMLLIWLAFGVYISLQPGISFLGHLGGFVPGLILGVFYEHRYKRNLDLYHKLSVGMVGVATVLLVAFACAPFTRASWHAAQALRAYDANDFDAGDKLLADAKRKPVRDAGSRLLVRHLELWRAEKSGAHGFEKRVLRLPLTHAGGVEIAGSEDIPFTFLKPVDDDDTVPLESGAAAP